MCDFGKTAKLFPGKMITNPMAKKNIFSIFYIYILNIQKK